MSPRTDNLHETFDREEEIKGSSDRAFGIVFAVVFGLIGGWRTWHAQSFGWPLLAVGGAFAAVAFTVPAVLAPLNRLWIRLGVLLATVMAPVMLALLFYGVMLPIGLLMRVFGKRPLALRFDAAAASYWVERRPPGPPPESMRNQF